jgi:hypothetical protein
LGTTLSDVLVDYALPFALCIAQGAVATLVWRDRVGFPLHFSSRVFHRNGQAAGAHGGQINYIVADERGFFRFEPFPAQNFLQAGAFILNDLMNVFQLQVAGTQGHGFGDALGDQAGFDAS